MDNSAKDVRVIFALIQFITDIYFLLMARVLAEMELNLPVLERFWSLLLVLGRSWKGGFVSVKEKINTNMVFL